MGLQPRGAVECGLVRQQIGFAQQAAGICRETGVKKAFDAAFGRAVHDWRGQQVVAGCKVLGAQVFQIQPQPACAHALLLRPLRLHGVIERAAKGFDQYVGCFVWQVGGAQGFVPGLHLHARVALRGKPLQGPRIVYPQPHALPALGQLHRQPPAHADIAVVVDYGAENVPEQAAVGHGDGAGWCQFQFR